MTEREASSEKSSKAVEIAEEYLETWKTKKNHKINNVDILLALNRGQMEVEKQLNSKSELEEASLYPYLSGAVLLKESVIKKLNTEIEVN